MMKKWPYLRVGIYTQLSFYMLDINSEKGARKKGGVNSALKEN